MLLDRREHRSRRRVSSRERRGVGARPPAAGRDPVPALERRGEGELRGVAERLGDRCEAIVAVAEAFARERHAPVGEVRERCDPELCGEAAGERGARQQRLVGQLGDRPAPRRARSSRCCGPPASVRAPTGATARSRPAAGATCTPLASRASVNGVELRLRTSGLLRVSRCRARGQPGPRDRGASRQLGLAGRLR